jgi:hypothetical protein
MIVCGAEVKRRTGDLTTASEWKQKGQSLLDSLVSGA